MNWNECLDLRMQRDEPMPWLREGSLVVADEEGEELRVIVRLTGDIITMVRGVEGEEEEEILEGYILTLIFSALVCVSILI
jgi:hypothetical protein